MATSCIEGRKLTETSLQIYFQVCLITTKHKCLIVVFILYGVILLVYRIEVIQFAFCHICLSYLGIAKIHSGSCMNCWNQCNVIITGKEPMPTFVNLDFFKSLVIWSPRPQGGIEITSRFGKWCYQMGLITNTPRSCSTAVHTVDA